MPFDFILDSASNIIDAHNINARHFAHNMTDPAIDIFPSQIIVCLDFYSLSVPHYFFLHSFTRSPTLNT